MSVNASEYHCPPDPKADLKMLGDEFAKFIYTDLEEEIDGGPPAQQQLPASVQQARPPAAAGAAATAADLPPFGQLEHAAHPVPHAVFNDEEDDPRAPQMRIGQRPAGHGQRQRRLDAEAANGPYWDPGQPLLPAPLVRDAIPAENLRGQRRNEYQQRRAVDEGELVNYNQLAYRRDRAAARNARDPNHEEAIMDPGLVELDAMMATLSFSNNWISDSAWQYYAVKYNSMRERELVQCPVGKDLVKYLANREKDRKRSQSNPQCMRNNLNRCYQKEQIDQEALHNVLRTGFLKERGRGRGALNGRTGRRNKNFHNSLKPLPLQTCYCTNDPTHM
jgi:hypothetical protein